jgi:hypothetical protein
MQTTITHTFPQLASETTEAQNLEPGCPFRMGSDDYILITPSDGAEVGALKLSDLSVETIQHNTYVLPAAMTIVATLPE